MPEGLTLTATDRLVALLCTVDGTNEEDIQAAAQAAVHLALCDRTARRILVTGAAITLAQQAAVSKRDPQEHLEGFASSVQSCHALLTSEGQA